MRAEFAVHMLNKVGKIKANTIAVRFETLLNELEALIGPEGREMSIVRTKLEEAAFFAKKAMAVNPAHHRSEL